MIGAIFLAVALDIGYKSLQTTYNSIMERQPLAPAPFPSTPITTEDEATEYVMQFTDY